MNLRSRRLPPVIFQIHAQNIADPNNSILEMQEEGLYNHEEDEAKHGGAPSAAVAPAVDPNMVALFTALCERPAFRSIIDHRQQNPISIHFRLFVYFRSSIELIRFCMNPLHAFFLVMQFFI